MRTIIRTSTPIAAPATAGAGIEDLLFELTWPGAPEAVGGFGVGVSALGIWERVTVWEVSVGCNESVVEGRSDEEDEARLDGV